MKTANDYLNMAAPGDITLGEMRRSILNGEIGTAIKQASRRPDGVRIRCLDENGQEIPDNVTLKEFRKRVSEHRAHLVIDDGEGGELV